MRLIHTADWHLGRVFHGMHLTEDQAYVLDQLVELAREAEAEAILLSGDVYDRAVPGTDAVNLLDDVLSRLVLGLEIPVVLIAGNHDSPDRLEFGARLMSSQGLHVMGAPASEPRKAVLRDRHGPLHVYGLPYAEPALVRERSGIRQPLDHDSAMALQTRRVREDIPEGTRSILLAHAFVTGGEESESERPLVVGGAGTVDAKHFSGIHYVALGHLHRPQSAGDPRIQYAGSLLKYSFSEAAHTKSVNLVEIDGQGECRIERIPLTPRRDVRRVEGLLRELCDQTGSRDGKEDYLLATLLDREPVLDAIGKLREAFPNVLHIERPHLIPSGDVRGVGRDHKSMSELDLFSAFFTQVTGEDLEEEEIRLFSTIVEALLQQEREASS